MTPGARREAAERGRPALGPAVRLGRAFSNRYRSSVFTPPHVIDFTERITVNGTPIPPQIVVDLVGRLKAPAEEAGARRFDETFEQMLSQAELFNEPLSLAVIDVDNFKEINDTYSHAAGDEVLRQIGAFLKDGVRRSDAPARMGGDEFGILLYHTDEPQAEKLVRQLLARCQDHAFAFNGQNISVTLSCGVAQYAPDTNSKQSLYFAADKALYAAKHQGRNQYAIHSQLPATES